MTSTTKRENLERIAAELMQRPVYICLKSEGTPEHIGGPKIGGTYHRRLDLSMMDYLKAQGRWQGRQPAIYVNDTDSDFWGDIMLHELAHAVDMGHDATEPDQVCAASLKLMHMNWSKNRDVVVEPVDENLGYAPLHGPRFVRACCHLWHRSMALGCCCNPEYIYQGSLYNVPEARVILNALGDELTRFEQLWVETILILPAPKQFDELFLNRKDKSE